MNVVGRKIGLAALAIGAAGVLAFSGVLLRAWYMRVQPEASTLFLRMRANLISIESEVTWIMGCGIGNRLG